MANISGIINGVRTASESLMLNGHHFYCFALISQGVEFLGAVSKYIHEGANINSDEDSGEKYRYAIKKYFPSRYKRYLNKNEIDLYGQLRCGPTHAFTPGKDIAFTTNNDRNSDEKHLEFYTNPDGSEKLIIVAEEYFEDFSQACASVTQELDSHGKDKSYIKVHRT